MLRPIENPAIMAQLADYAIPNGALLHTKTLYHSQRATPKTPGRTLLFIHGGAAATNHTVIERPARGLLDRGLFDTVILPDRRGCGASSPVQRMFSFEEQAEDMRLLLDVMEIGVSLTVMGISYGGPIALVQAYDDRRVERVILWASSPTLRALGFPYNLLPQTGLMSWYLRQTYRREVGKKEPRYPDYDFVYEMPPSKRQAWSKWREILNHTPAERLDSILLELESMFNPPNRSIPEHIQLDIPVLQIIGDRDETWGGGMPEIYRQRFRRFTQVILPGIGHKDALWKADLFLATLEEQLYVEIA